ncbi:acyl-CoA dehydrogenase domain-containing protein [Thermodesulfatator indicus DSM 15286]|uniref:Cyclohex-1-ene-1-carbonyl-CoA dehydrogenase n=1 Tax=Thermodesulfatator indicus (strain DSM 15286 / JCM 11887 / CIR29812) TaxID=667014 RepID=F8AAB6_THEID|nr:acyl-CoA dehydrogenase family protein [Thermodesulfatator indicus]AEH44253.1 acyl-CoA dehydrogenase domain-containing protein [Thermodesulfatator indicus DSM 15286]
MIERKLTKEQQVVVEVANYIGRNYIAPHAIEWDEKEVYDPTPIKAMAQADLFGLLIPKEYGGLGFGSTETALAMETLSKYCPGVATTFAAGCLGALPLLIGGTKAQKEKYLPLIAQGKALCAFALTEPQAGSDAAAIKTTAKKDGDHYILNGIKTWITNGGIADIYVIIALTDPKKGPRGASAFIVHKNDPGFVPGRKEKKMGLRSSVTSELILMDCRIPKDRLIGREGMGFILAVKALDLARPGVAAQAIGLAQGAMEVSLLHAKRRVQFGQPVYNFQAVSHTFAEMAARLEAARSLLYDVTRMIDSKAKNISGASAMVKFYATDMAMWVSERAVQMMGGLGYSRDSLAQKYMRDAKCLQIYEGTNEIQKNVLARELAKIYQHEEAA